MATIIGEILTNPFKWICTFCLLIKPARVSINQMTRRLLCEKIVLRQFKHFVARQLASFCCSAISNVNVGFVNCDVTFESDMLQLAAFVYLLIIITITF